MRNRLEMDDAVDVDNSGAMDAYESDGVKPCGQIGQGRSVEKFLASGMKIHIDTGGFDPIDINQANETCFASAFHD